jgi:hypothetical protein
MCSQASRKADEMLLGCSDSVGHVLFEIGGSFPDAAAICRMLERYLSDAQVSDQALAACVGGVFMQFYEPVAPSARTPVVSEFDPLELCNSLPEDLFLSCAQAVHYAAGSALRDLSRDTSLGDLSPPELLEIYKRRVPTALSEGVAMCSTLGEGASLCERELGRYGVQALRGFPQETAHSLICDALSRDSSRAYCLQTARNILG